MGWREKEFKSRQMHHTPVQPPFEQNLGEMCFCALVRAEQFLFTDLGPTKYVLATCGSYFSDSLVYVCGVHTCV